jgi:F0F1-type ATP synthase membrane subunit b/b'
MQKLTNRLLLMTHKRKLEKAYTQSEQEATAMWNEVQKESGVLISRLAQKVLTQKMTEDDKKAYADYALEQLKTK